MIIAITSITMSLIHAFKVILKAERPKETHTHTLAYTHKGDSLMCTSVYMYKRDGKRERKTELSVVPSMNSSSVQVSYCGPDNCTRARALRIERNKKPMFVFEIM